MPPSAKQPNWIANVKTTSVYEGPPGTLGNDKTPTEMARVILACNPTKKTGSIILYLNYVINRSGKKMAPAHKAKIRAAMAIIRVWRKLDEDPNNRVNDRNSDKNSR